MRGAIGYALAGAGRADDRQPAWQAWRRRPASRAIATDVLGFALIAAGPEAAAEDGGAADGRAGAAARRSAATPSTCSSTSAWPPCAGARAPAQIERANIALDQARAGRRKVAFFDAEAYGDPSSNLSLMSEMLAAIEDGEMELHYQPKFDLRRPTVTGVEALVRWRHPTRGMLSPDLFIPMAEETGHIRALTEWVLQRAIEDQADFARAGHELDMSVNISGRTAGRRGLRRVRAGAGGPGRAAGSASRSPRPR